LKEEDIEYFRELLTKSLEELLGHAKDTISDITAPKENLPDPTDRASFESGRDEDNTFGVCEKCGEDISVARLKARPVTTQCIDCKTKEEATERALGI